MRVVALLGALVLGGPVAAAAQPAQGVIGFTRDLDGPGNADHAIFLARADGSGVREVARGLHPELAPDGSAVSYSQHRDGAYQLVVTDVATGAERQVTEYPNGDEQFGPFRSGAIGSAWSPEGGWLAIRLMEGSTTTLALVRPDGSGYRRLPFGHLSGGVLAWRDEKALAVGTDVGLRLVTVDGTETPVRGAEASDTPATWLPDGGLVVNGDDGIGVVEPTGTRRVLLRGARAWDRLGDGVLWTTDDAYGVVRPDGTSERLGPVEGRTVLAATGARTPPLAEMYGAIVELGTGPPRRLVEGGELTFSPTAVLDAVVPPGGTTAPPGAPTGAATGAPTSAPTGAAPTAPGRTTTAPDGAVAAPDVAGDDRPPGRSTVVATVPRAAAVDTRPASLLRNALLALLLLVLIAFPAELFNNTLERHYDEVRGWFGRRGPRRSPAELPRAARVGAFAAFTAVAALLYTLLDPHAAFDAPTLRLYAGLAVGLAVVTLLFALAPLAYVRRRHGERGLLRVLPGALLVGVVCVVVSRVTRFEPGYLYGILAGFAFARAFPPEEEGRTQAVAAVGVLAASALAWAAWQPVDAAAGDGDPGLLLGLADATLATVALGGLQGLVVGLLPLHALPGHAVSRWSRPAWAALYGLVLFVFLTVLLRHEAQEAPAFGTWLALFLGFGAVSVAFWGWFRWRPASSG